MPMGQTDGRMPDRYIMFSAVCVANVKANAVWCVAAVSILIHHACSAMSVWLLVRQL